MTPTTRDWNEITTLTNEVTSYLTSEEQTDDILTSVTETYSSLSTDLVVEGPKEFGALNYLLLAVSAVVLVCIIGGVGVLVFREIKRVREAREKKFQQKLRERRKGISGMSGASNSGFLPEGLEEFLQRRSADDTSYTAISVTPNEDSRGLDNTVSTSLSSDTPTMDKRADSSSLRRVSFANNRGFSQESMSLTSLCLSQKIDAVLNDSSSLARVSVTSSDTGVWRSV